MNVDNPKELEAEIRKVVEEVIEKDVSALGIDDNVLKVMGLDSMTALEIMAGVEQHFKIRIQEKDLPKISSIKSIMEVLKKYVKKKETN